MTIGALAVAGRVLGERVPWDAAFLAGPLIVVANCLPITPGGIGLAEAVSSELFASLGSADGAEMMILTRICIALVALPGVLPLLRSADFRETSVAQTPIAALAAGCVGVSETTGTKATALEISDRSPMHD